MGNLGKFLLLHLLLRSQIGLIVQEPGLAASELRGVPLHGDHVQIGSETPNDITAAASTDDESFCPRVSKH